MNQELVTATAKIYSERFTTEELVKMFAKSDPTVRAWEAKAAEIAINIQNGKYGSQTELFDRIAPKP